MLIKKLILQLNPMNTVSLLIGIKSVPYFFRKVSHFRTKSIRIFISKYMFAIKCILLNIF